jgi:hypothetical protein
MFKINQIKFNAIALFVSAIFLISTGLNAQTTIEIQFSPNVLNLQNQGQVVTIHTDIPYGTVEAETVYLNDVEIQSWKADNQGNFVAKFNMDAIQGLESLVVGEYNTFTLDGTCYDGNTFTGTDEVLIVDNVPSGQAKK